jgi:hypothetical protein
MLIFDFLGVIVQVVFSEVRGIWMGFILLNLIVNELSPIQRSDHSSRKVLHSYQKELHHSHITNYINFINSIRLLCTFVDYEGNYRSGFWFLLWRCLCY